MTTPSKPICEFCHISKSFPGVRALSDVSFSIYPGSVHGLLGENGAGKSTLMKILGGDYSIDEGSLKINDQAVIFNQTKDSQNAGISIVHQELQLIDQLTVGENLMLGRMPNQFGLINYTQLFDFVQKKLDQLGVQIRANTKIEALSSGQRQMVEIAKAIIFDARIIALDEPTSSLSAQESALLFKMVNQLKSQGAAIIYISHRLDEIFTLCDRATILRDGQIAINLDTLTGLTRNDLVRYMVGREISDIWGWQSRPLGAIRLEAQQIKTHFHPKPINFNVKSGEIVGFFGLVGSGRSELMRTFFGVDPILTGQLVVDQKTMHFNHPKQAIEAGLILMTEERKTDGIIQGQSVSDNITISARRHFSRFWIKTPQEAQLSDRAIERLQIKTPHRHQDITHLSGGNQQKVLLSRWLAEPNIKVMIIDEPTRGIDVGAKAEIYKVLYSLAEKGMAIIVVSSELPEIMGITDRIFVMRESEISAEFVRNQYQESLILEAAFPLAAAA